MGLRRAIFFEKKSCQLFDHNFLARHRITLILDVLESYVLRLSESTKKNHPTSQIRQMPGISSMPNPADQKKDTKKTKCSDRVWNWDQGMHLVQNLMLNRMLTFSDLHLHFLQVFSIRIQMPNLASAKMVILACCNFTGLEATWM